MASTTLLSPLGPITVVANEHAVTSVVIGQEGGSDSSSILDHAVTQLTEYFAGERTKFSVPVELPGTEFQRAVWAELQTIPFGSTASYQELGVRAGLGNAPRAVGGALGKNPVPIIVPCHRILAHDRRITGYSGGDGIPTKEKLLSLEGISYR
jgi:methylated-DNA-[protein]-cysteine S-methyltransferase